MNEGRELTERDLRKCVSMPVGQVVRVLDEIAPANAETIIRQRPNDFGEKPSPKKIVELCKTLKSLEGMPETEAVKTIRRREKDFGKNPAVLIELLKASGKSPTLKAAVEKTNIAETKHINLPVAIPLLSAEHDESTRELQNHVKYTMNTYMKKSMGERVYSNNPKVHEKDDIQALTTFLMQTPENASKVLSNSERQRQLADNPELIAKMVASSGNLRRTLEKKGVLELNGLDNSTKTSLKLFAQVHEGLDDDEMKGNDGKAIKGNPAYRELLKQRDNILTQKTIPHDEIAQLDANVRTAVVRSIESASNEGLLQGTPEAAALRQRATQLNDQDPYGLQLSREVKKTQETIALRNEKTAALNNPVINHPAFAKLKTQLNALGDNPSHEDMRQVRSDISTLNVFAKMEAALDKEPLKGNADLRKELDALYENPDDDIKINNLEKKMQALPQKIQLKADIEKNLEGPLLKGTEATRHFGERLNAVDLNSSTARKELDNLLADIRYAEIKATVEKPELLGANADEMQKKFKALQLNVDESPKEIEKLLRNVRVIAAREASNKQPTPAAPTTENAAPKKEATIAKTNRSKRTKTLKTKSARQDPSKVKTPAPLARADSVVPAAPKTTLESSATATRTLPPELAKATEQEKKAEARATTLGTKNPADKWAKIIEKSEGTTTIKASKTGPQKHASTVDLFQAANHPTPTAPQPVTTAKPAKVTPKSSAPRPG